MAEYRNYFSQFDGHQSELNIYDSNISGIYNTQNQFIMFQNMRVINCKSVVIYIFIF